MERSPGTPRPLPSSRTGAPRGCSRHRTPRATTATSCATGFAGSPASPAGRWAPLSWSRGVEQRAAEGTGPWDRILALVVDAGTQEVPVLPYHRIQIGGDRPTGGRPAPDLAQALAGADDLHLRYGTVTKDGGTVVYRIHRLR